ncbi:MAG: hypothetical protein IPO21_10975 [Bacteroidales bacterium]|nr:hypothetical protein [Bacteroidales bacterium]
MNTYDLSSDNYSEYYKNCQEAKDWQYPAFMIEVFVEVGDEQKRNIFDFIRTPSSYKLIGFHLL